MTSDKTADKISDLINTCDYVDASDIVPKNWKPHFFAKLSEDAPFSWGDNNLTMVTAQRFKDHVENVLDKDDAVGDEVIEYEKFMELLDALEEQGLYINLEC